MKDNKEIEAEVQARVNFKLNDILGAMKQAATRNWQMAFRSGNPKYSHYWEAFEQMTAMLEKERAMPLPYDQMAIQNKKFKRDAAVEQISALVIRRGEHPENEHHIIRTIVSAVEKAQNF